PLPSNLGAEAPPAFPQPLEPETTPSPTAAEVQAPKESEVYVSPYRKQTSEGHEEAAKSSYLRPDSFSVEPAQAAPSAPPVSARVSSSAPGKPARSTARTSRTRAEWESLIGGRLLNWIGAIAIIIGIASFLGYGYQNHWITPSLLVGIGALAGLALLAG